jgi:hypothetical protein
LVYNAAQRGDLEAIRKLRQEGVSLEASLFTAHVMLRLLATSMPHHHSNSVSGWIHGGGRLCSWHAAILKATRLQGYFFS